MLCKLCKIDKDKTCYSNAQLKKKHDDRKCKDCSNESTLENQQVLFSTLIDWLRKNGAEFPFLEIKHYNERFRGIVATNNIYREKQILKVPNKCIMTTLKAYESEIGLEVKKSGWEPHSSHTWLALMLLQEKLKSNSFWKPFIDILPRNYNDFPQFYTAEELDQLKSSFVLDMIKARNISLEIEFKQMELAIPEFCKKITLRDFVWARIAIISRVFHIELHNDKNTQGIVPMADMLNHSKEPGTKWSFYPDEDAFIISSDKFLFKGKEIFDTYGSKCNSRYFVNYGFTLSDNQVNNQTVLFINPDKLIDSQDIPLKKNKLELLTDVVSIDDSFCDYDLLIRLNKETLVTKDKNFRFQFLILLDAPVNQKSMNGLNCTFALFGMLRLIYSTDKEFLLISKQENFNNFLTGIKPLSYDNEFLVLKELSSMCKLRLDTFSSTIEIEQKELLNIEPYSNRWNILNMLIGEKRVLQYYYELGLFVNNLLNSGVSFSQIGRHLRKHPEFIVYYKVFWDKI